jgi:hypothetical protein
MANDPLRKFLTSVRIIAWDRTHEWIIPVKPKQQNLSANCRCGLVKLEATGRPILTGTCYCKSCQEAGRRFEQLAAAPPVLNPDGGTDFVLYRKDRVECAMGQEYLEEHRLRPDSPTRRIVAVCCNSAIFLEGTLANDVPEPLSDRRPAS